MWVILSETGQIYRPVWSAALAPKDLRFVRLHTNAPFALKAKQSWLNRDYFSSTWKSKLYTLQRHKQILRNMHRRQADRAPAHHSKAAGLP